MTADIESLLSNVDSLRVEDVRNLSVEEIDGLLAAVGNYQQGIQTENQLLFYKPVSKEAVRFHCSTVQQRVILGGNGSSKSETQIVDLIIEMTGIVPHSLADVYPREKLRAPIHARLIVESFTNTWPGLREKLQWNKWTGLRDKVRGHWGWIPKHMLKKGSWEESWSERERTLTLNNNSTLQIMSHDQEVQDMASTSIHRVAVDEGPKAFEWRENLMRLREGGSISLAMTPPDDESKSWHAAWVYDDLYCKGLPGPDKVEDIESFTFNTQDNAFIDQDAIARAISGMSESQRATRLTGAFMHLGGLVYPVYTDTPRFWCFKCHDKAFVVPKHDTLLGQIRDVRLNKPYVAPGLTEMECGKCGSNDVCEYTNFIEPDSRYYGYPTVFLIDPHPRKAIMCIWVAVDPYDDAAQVAELEVGGDVDLETVRDRILAVENDLGLNIVARIMDSKMKGQAAHNAGQRGVTVGRAYDQVGIRCKGADNDFMVGRTRLISLLQPDSRTRRPRYVVFNTCKRTNFMLKRYTWDEYVNNDGKDQKQTPRTLNDDFPSLMRYYANEGYRYATLTMGGGMRQVTKRPRSRAYG